jgi:hypothetical protein
MESLRVNNITGTLIFLFLLLCSCQTNRTLMITTIPNKELYSVEIESKRVIQECYFMNAKEENNWRHQYSLNMLNEKNEVISAFFPTNQDKKQCLDHLTKVEKILKNESRVRLCLRGKIERRDRSLYVPQIYDFRSLGKHESPYHSLIFDTICNSRECYSISDTWTYTCPDFTGNH